MQDAAPCAVDKASGDGEDPQAQPFGLVGCGRGGEGEAGAPGQQVLGQGADRQPDPVLVGVVERQVAQPGVLRRADAVLDPGVAAVPQLEVGELAVRPSALWVPETLRTLCDVLILVDQSAQPIVSSDVVDPGSGVVREGP